MEPENPLNTNNNKEASDTNKPDVNPLISTNGSNGDNMLGPSTPLPPIKKKNKNMKFIFIGVGAFVLILLITVVAISVSNSNRKKTEQVNQYKAGYEKGKSDQKAISEQEFIDRNGSDLRVYKAPSEFGSFELSIPKTWSWVVTPKSSEGTFTGQADPDFVDSTAKLHGFSLDLKKADYDKVKKDLDDKTAKSKKAIQASDITVSGISGRKYVGVFDEKTKQKAEVVIVPIREKVMTFRTDDPDKYSSTFNNIINTSKLNP